MDATTAEAVDAVEQRAQDRAQLEALAATARTGDDGAFDLLARRLSRRLIAFARRALQDPALAEEAVQEALVRIYKGLPKYERDNILAWAFTITHRVCSDIGKKEGRRRKHLALAEVDVALDPTSAVEVREAVERALQDLPDEQRITFLLRQQGLAYEDIAAITRVPIGTVRSRLHQARTRLRARLAPTFHREGGR